jgi:hypothetical protein
MSQNSKAKRDKRKKQQAKRPFLRLNAQQQVQNHAVLTNEDGQTMGNAENPVPMLAMLKHLSNVQEKEGRKVNLEYSELLQKLLDTLAAESEQTADEYLDKLVAEFETVEAEEGEEAAEAAEGEVVEAAAEATPAADSDSKPQA